MDFNFGNYDHLGEAAEENRREMEAAMDARLAQNAADKRTADRRFRVMLALTVVSVVAAIVAAVASVLTVVA